MSIRRAPSRSVESRRLVAVRKDTSWGYRTARGRFAVFALECCGRSGPASLVGEGVNVAQDRRNGSSPTGRAAGVAPRARRGEPAALAACRRPSPRSRTGSRVTFIGAHRSRAQPDERISEAGQGTARPEALPDLPPPVSIPARARGATAGQRRGDRRLDRGEVREARPKARRPGSTSSLRSCSSPRGRELPAPGLATAHAAVTSRQASSARTAPLPIPSRTEAVAATTAVTIAIGCTRSGGA